MYLLSYAAIRSVLFLIGLLPYRAIHALGRFFGLLTYHLIPSYRKKALSNLALASSLNLNNTQIVQIAKEAMQNLAITALEYGKLAKKTDIEKIAICENPEKAQSLITEKKPPIFFCGHQANWEILFLEGTSRMPGIAIGRPIKNHYLYQWIVQIREKFGGKIITPKNAAKEGLRALRHGSFLGIVGDQGMPDSGFRSPFLGREAWTSPLPAMLSYRTGSPVIVAVTVREKNKYRIHYSEPIFPDQTQPAEQEIKRIMLHALSLFEKSVAANPGQWLWQHNRWKQQTLGKLRRIYRQDAIAILLPKTKEECETFLPDLKTFRLLYPHEFILVYAPENVEIEIPDAVVQRYSDPKELLIEDYRSKLLFDLANCPEVRSHYKKLAVSTAVNLDELKKGLPHPRNLTELLKNALLLEPAHAI